MLQVVIFACIYCYSTLPTNSRARPLLGIDHKTAQRPRGLGRERRASEARYGKNVEDYLMQFGYLPRSSANALRTTSQLVNAVKNLQFFAGLNTTGKIDASTLDLMSK